MIRPALLALTLLLGGCAPPSGECWLIGHTLRPREWRDMCAVRRPLADCEADLDRLCPGWRR